MKGGSNGGVRWDEIKNQPPEIIGALFERYVNMAEYQAREIEILIAAHKKEREMEKEIYTTLIARAMRGEFAPKESK